MKKLYYLSLMLFLSFMINSSQEKTIIKRKIVILDAYNASLNKKHDYLSRIIRETIKVNMIKDCEFCLINFSNIDLHLDSLNLKKDDYLNQNKLKEIALSLGSDIIIYTEYDLKNDELALSYHVFDLLMDDIPLKDTSRINPGVDIFTDVDKICNGISEIISKKYTKINKEEYENIIIKKYGKDKLATFNIGIQKNIKENIKMVNVGGGIFVMGNKENYEEDEIQENLISVDDFWIGNYEVTQMEWEMIMGNNPSRHKGDLLPVDNISWYDAIEFCNKKSIKEELSTCYIIDKNNKDPNNLNYRDEIKWKVSCDFTKSGYRLPTEAEWEYAAKGGIKSMGYIYSGSNDLYEAAWFYQNSDKESHLIGQKISNELELYDMSGNVYEWCWDWFDVFGEIRNKVNPNGPVQGKYRVMRGGCMNNKEDECTSFNRTLKPAYENLSKYGLRLVRSVKQ